MLDTDEELRSESAKLRTELSTCQARLNDMRASTSWRITAPVRVIGRQVRRVAGLFGALKRRAPSRNAPPPSEVSVSAQETNHEEAGGRSLIRDFVEHVAERSGCSRIVEICCGQVDGAAAPKSRPEPAGPAPGQRAEGCQTHRAPHCWTKADVRAGWPPELDRIIFRDSIVVCSYPPGPAADGVLLLRTLRDMLEDAPFGVVTIPRPADPNEFAGRLESAGLQVMFDGLTGNGGPGSPRNTAIAVVRRPQPVLIPPSDFRVEALMFAYNEEDVIACTLEHLTSQGTEVHLIDNWSTDNTVRKAAAYLGRGVQKISRFPESGPAGTYDLYELLLHVEKLAQASKADWILVNDADEIRESPWTQLNLRQALYQVDRAGFNAIDYTALDFHPTGGPFFGNGLIQPQFSYFEFGTRPGHFRLIKAWRRQTGAIEFAWSGGHEVRFTERRVYPFKFLLRHYPIRTQEQGQRKVFVDRLPRFNVQDRQVRGWHIQYDGLSREQSFVRDPATLLRFDEKTFYRQYLVERLSGVGIVRG